MTPVGVLGAVYSYKGGIISLLANARLGESSLGGTVGSFVSIRQAGSNGLALVIVKAFLVLELLRLSKLGSKNLPWKNYEF